MENYLQNYLMHHGVEGQKWGVRNGPPYPLDHKTQKANFKDVKKAARRHIGERSLYNPNARKRAHSRLARVAGDFVDKNKNLYDQREAARNKICEHVANTINNPKSQAGKRVREDLEIESGKKISSEDVKDNHSYYDSFEWVIESDKSELSRFAPVRQAYWDAERSLNDARKRFTNDIFGEYANVRIDNIGTTTDYLFRDTAEIINTNRNKRAITNSIYSI